MSLGLGCCLATEDWRRGKGDALLVGGVDLASCLVLSFPEAWDAPGGRQQRARGWSVIKVEVERTGGSANITSEADVPEAEVRYVHTAKAESCSS